MVAPMVVPRFSHGFPMVVAHPRLDFRWNYIDRTVRFARGWRGPHFLKKRQGFSERLEKVVVRRCEDS